MLEPSGRVDGRQLRARSERHRSSDVDDAEAWGGDDPMGIPSFIVTHEVPEVWSDGTGPFTLVTDGVESAIEQAQVVAGDKPVGVAGGDIAMQRLGLGLLDELWIHLGPSGGQRRVLLLLGWPGSARGGRSAWRPERSLHPGHLNSIRLEHLIDECLGVSRKLGVGDECELHGTHRRRVR